MTKRIIDAPWDEHHEPQTSEEYAILMLDPDREFDMDPLDLLLRREEEMLEAINENTLHDRLIARDLEDYITH